MPELKLKQLISEADTWKRSVEYMIEENIHLKKRLTEILKNGYDKAVLEKAEYFQNEFIKEDELVGLIRDDLAQIDKLLIRDSFENGTVNEINRKFLRLRNNMHTAEKHFSELKLDFSNYLHAMLNLKN